MEAYRHTGGTQDTKGEHFQRAQHLGMHLSEVPHSSYMPPFLLRAPHFCILHFLLEINLSFTSLILNFSALFNHVSLTRLGCSTLHLRDKLLAKGMGREVQILS